ncbi:MAG: hypothetical protein HWN67_07830 [Candidatus Helarchaeota archaeon]|nr:hypothetical protein [Candidatus Helarchaeota archaeon]
MTHPNTKRNIFPKAQVRIENEIRDRIQNSDLLVSSNAKAFLTGEYLIFHSGTSLLMGVNARTLISFKFYNKSIASDAEEVNITRIYERDQRGIFIDLTQRLTKDWIEIIKDSCIKWKDALKKVLATIKHPLYNENMVRKINDLCLDLFIISNIIIRGGLGSSAVFASLLALATMHKLGIVSEKLTSKDRTLIFLVAILLEDAYHHGKRHVEDLKGIAGGFSVIPCIFPLEKGEIFQLDLTKFFELQKSEQSQFKEIPINDFIQKIYQIKNLDLLGSPMISTLKVNSDLLNHLYFTIYYSGTRTSTPKMIKNMSSQSKEFWDIYSLTFDQMSKISEVLVKRLQDNGHHSNLKEIKTLFDMLQSNFNSLGIVPLNISRTMNELNTKSNEKLYFGKVLGASGGGSFLLITTKPLDQNDEDIVFKYIPNAEKIAEDSLKVPSSGVIIHPVPLSKDFKLENYL